MRCSRFAAHVRIMPSSLAGIAGLMTNHNRTPLTPAALLEASNYAREVFRRWGLGADWLAGAEDADEPTLALEARLRRRRQLGALGIIWRELQGEHDIEQTGRLLSALAIDCLEAALAQAEQRVEARHGQLFDAEGQPARLAILALGKLGGDELNFNSDVDLVYCHAGVGPSNGRRALGAAEYFARVARELSTLIETVGPHGRVWVIDTRLRPFGQAGALTWSVDAMEQYFLNEGRSWERYAWLKARAVAGDVGRGRELLERIRPFVFRRYLDYGLFDSLRALHGEIDQRSRREALEADIKRGPGGIRELEFVIQSLQLLRGGREPALRVPGFLPALRAARGLGLFEAATADRIDQAYRFLRRLENCLQLATGRQTHELPDTPAMRAAVARLMGAETWSMLARDIESCRESVRDLFRRQFENTQQPDTSIAAWPPDEALESRLAEHGFVDPNAAAQALRSLQTRLERRALSAEGRRRLERLMPELLAEVVRHDPPDPGFVDLLKLIETVARRSAYLALLHERPQTLERCVRVFRASDRLADWVTESPQLLDDLLAPDQNPDLPRQPSLPRDDPEASLAALARYRQAGFMRIALGQLDGRFDRAGARVRLTRLAESVIALMAELFLPDGLDLAIIGYGNLGAGELHYSSDLDLVFLHPGGDPPLSRVRRLISAMQMPQPGGCLYEIDTRLRPNGNAGMLISTLESFADYQQHHAWTWEHQALIRARCVCGPAALGREFDAIRAHTLAVKRDPTKLREDLSKMRRRQLRQRTESPPKQLLGHIQFIAELGVLERAERHPELLTVRATIDQLRCLRDSDWIEQGECRRLIEIFERAAALRDRRFLERQSDETVPDSDRDQVSRAWRTYFDEPAAPAASVK